MAHFGANIPFGGADPLALNPLKQGANLIDLCLLRLSLPPVGSGVQPNGTRLAYLNSGLSRFPFSTSASTGWSSRSPATLSPALALSHVEGANRIGSCLVQVTIRCQRRIRQDKQGRLALAGFSSIPVLCVHQSPGRSTMLERLGTPLFTGSEP